VGEQDIWQALLHQENKGFRALYNSAVIDGYTDSIFSILDKGMLLQHHKINVHFHFVLMWAIV